MRNAIHCVAATTLAVLALSNRGPEDVLAFQPRKDSEVRKTFSERTRWRVTELEQLVNGQPVPAPSPEISATNVRELVVLDRFVAPGARRPKLLRRTYESLSGELKLEFAVQGMSESIDAALSSALLGAQVEFQCDADESACSARFTSESAGDAALLPGLAEDLDLRAFLPTEDMGVEDWWNVDAAALARVLAPGGQLALNPDRSSIPSSELLDPLEVATTMLCVLAENTGELGGDVTVTWSKNKELEGRSLAVLEIDWKSTSKDALAERARAMLAAAGAPSERTAPTIDFGVESEGKGLLLWDLAAGRAHSFALELDSTIAAELSWTQGGQRSGYRFKVAAQSKLSASFETP